MLARGAGGLGKPQASRLLTQQRIEIKRVLPGQQPMRAGKALQIASDSPEN
jgi:hypothetical protein